MKIQFLGTAAAEGAPALFCVCGHCNYARNVLGREVRTRAGSIIDGVLKLDFGPDSFKQMIDNRIDYTHIRALLVTHSHNDHLSVSDLFYRRQGFAQLPDDEPPLIVYGNAKVGEKLAPALNRFIEFRRLKAFETTTIEGYAVTPLEAVHCVDQSEPPVHPVVYQGKTLSRSEEPFFYLIEKEGRSLLYAHDTGPFTDADMEFLSGRKIGLITMDCTEGARDCNYYGHMCVRDNLMMRERLLACGAADDRTVFVANHFSHNGLVPHEELERLLPGFVVSFDSMTLQI